MNAMPFFRGFSALLFLFALGATEVAAQTVPCDTNIVSLSNNTVSVAASGGDDTVNIQCALDFANDNGIPVVRLNNGNFLISELEVEDFNGTFQGTTRTSTLVTVMDNSIDCAAIIGGGRTATAIRFISGEPRIRFMTLFVGNPCMDNTQLVAVVHFTGQFAGAACGNDVIFGNVDRMRIEGNGIGSGVANGVGAWAEGHLFGTCRDTLTGTLKVNRTEFDGLDRGILTSMQAGAQVDVNFSEFSDTRIGYEMQRGNQNTSIAFNDFTGESNSSRNYFGVVANNGPGAPAQTGMAVKGNTFNLSGAGFPPIGFISFFADSPTRMTFSATDNVFNMSGDAVGVAGFNFSNGFVANNNFNGSGFAGVWIGNDQFGQNPSAEDWTVVGNSFGNLGNVIDDVFLDTRSVRAIVGGGQNATVEDNGTDNTVL